MGCQCENMVPAGFELVTSMRYDEQLSFSGSSFYMPHLHRARLLDGAQQLGWKLLEVSEGQEWLKAEKAFRDFLSLQVFAWRAEQEGASIGPLKVRFDACESSKLRLML